MVLHARRQPLPAQTVPPCPHTSSPVKPGDGGERREDRAEIEPVPPGSRSNTQKSSNAVLGPIVYAHIRMVERSEIEGGGVVAAEVCPGIVTDIRSPGR